MEDRTSCEFFVYGALKLGLGLRTAWLGAEVEGDSEPDMEGEADIGSITEKGGTKRGSGEFEQEDLVELLEE